MAIKDIEMAKQKEKVRLSNIELLRIIAMFLVLVVHADFFSLGKPTVQDISAAPLPSFTRFFFQSLSILCVDVFVLISGWFGIKPTFNRVASFLFQCFFFFIGIYAVCLFLGLEILSVRGIAGCFFLLQWNWFIKAYIGLMILAPVLNVFIERASERQFRNVLICFYVFQTLYGWMSGAAVFFESGYSTMSFIGLYMLARYVHLYPSKYTQKSPVFDFAVFFAIIMFQTIIAFCFLRSSAHIFSYISPLVVLSSLYLLLLFSKLHIQSRVINWIAISSFAVFLLHTNPNLCSPYFIPTIKQIYAHFNGLMCLFVIFLFLLSVFISAIFIDKIRIAIWNMVKDKIIPVKQ